MTFDYGTERAFRIDFVRFLPVNNTAGGIEKGDFYCYEVKSSVADFSSVHGHNFVGDYNYYIMPQSVFESVKNMIPYRVGVFCPNASCDALVSVKQAKRAVRERPVSEILLMMFRSAVRDINKKQKNSEKKSHES